MPPAPQIKSVLRIALEESRLIKAKPTKVYLTCFERIMLGACRVKLSNTPLAI